MNPIDILGGMLGRKSGGSGGGGSRGGGLGGAILESILKGGRPGRSSSGGSRGNTPGRPAGSPRIREDANNQEFDSLEDLLRHAHKRGTSRRGAQPERQQRFPEPEPHIARRQTEFTAEYEGNPEPFTQKAQTLVIAMINAAKADGKIAEEEQAAIIEQLGEVSQDEIHFLRSEFSKPLDVKEFVWSVPLGMERQVYAVSLMAITLDENSEAQYLRELGHGFRLSLEECNQIHAQFNAPQLR